MTEAILRKRFEERWAEIEPPNVRADDMGFVNVRAIYERCGSQPPDEVVLMIGDCFLIVVDGITWVRRDEFESVAHAWLQKYAYDQGWRGNTTHSTRPMKPYTAKQWQRSFDKAYFYPRRPPNAR